MQQPNGGTTPADINAMFATDRDRGADLAAPAERQEQPKPDAGQSAHQAEAQPPPPASEQDSSEAQPRHVPLSELLAERKKRQETERLIEEMKGRNSAYEQQLSQFLHRQNQPVQHHPQQQQPAPIPDPIVDPQGHAYWVQSQIAQQVNAAQAASRDQVLHVMEANARKDYGHQFMSEALQFAQQNGLVGQFTQYPDPWATLGSWYQQQKVVSTIGGDLESYNERLRKEGAERALAELKKGNGNGQPQQQPRFPTTLADQTAAGAQMGSAPLSGNAAAAAMFASDRNRKAF